MLTGDLDAFQVHMTRGMDGAALLDSRQRLREMHMTWQKAAVRWPGEKRLQAIGDGLRRTAAAGTELDVLP